MSGPCQPSPECHCFQSFQSSLLNAFCLGSIIFLTFSSFFFFFFLRATVLYNSFSSVADMWRTSWDDCQLCLSDNKRAQDWAILSPLFISLAEIRAQRYSNADSRKIKLCRWELLEKCWLNLFIKIWKVKTQIWFNFRRAITILAKLNPNSFSAGNSMWPKPKPKSKFSIIFFNLNEPPQSLGLFVPFSHSVSVHTGPQYKEHLHNKRLFQLLHNANIAKSILNFQLKSNLFIEEASKKVCLTLFLLSE